MVRLEAGPCEQRLNSRVTSSGNTQMRVGKQLLAAKKPFQKRAEWQPKLESTYSFSWGWWRRSCCRWRWFWVRTNFASHRSMWQRFWVLRNSCSELCTIRPSMTAKERGGYRFSLNTSHVIGGREELDGQHGHISQPWLGFTPPSGPFMRQTGLKNAFEFTIIILWLRKTN